MKKILRNIAAVLTAGAVASSVGAFAQNPADGAKQKTDSVDVFAYILGPGDGGLRIAFDDNGVWRPVGGGNGIELVKSDFGAWGSHKKMYEPVLYRTPQGWRCLWWVSDRRETVASADSPDLMHWKPQRYANKKDAVGFMDPSMKPATAATETVNGKQYTGGIVRLSRPEFLELQAFALQSEAEYRRNGERLTDDAANPALSLPVTLTARRSSQPAMAVSPHLFGIFFEDINYGADGGLYAELLQNRDFEYLKGEGRAEGWGPTYAWTLTDAKGNAFEPFIATESPVHPNNPHYLSIIPGASKLLLTNSGFDGISLKKGETYTLSLFVRISGGKPATLRADLIKKGKSVGSATVEIGGEESGKNGGWSKVTAEIKAKASVSGAELRLTIPKDTGMDLDMVSLFPRNTWKGRPNGLRPDLASVLDSIHPRFVRFPGGCVAHGNGIDNIYDWKGSIGPLESRKPIRNLWGYHQTRGLGFHEFFEFCEDLGAEPLPVLAAGVPCQNSWTPAHCSVDENTSCGQQGGIPMEEMPAYIQDILDLVEYANGPADSEWGARRAAAGHPEPFNLKFLGIGNEDLISDLFKERFRMIYDAVTAAYPDIKVVGTAGPFYQGSDYEEGWRFARSLNVPLVDEHYYVSPGWFINHRDFYDGYPRGGSDVYLGEYASHVPGRKNNIETALSVALYLTDIERNSDVVKMTTYAPLLAKKDHTQWNPDMIYFDNDSIRLTPDYYVQKLFGANQADEYLPMTLSFDTLNPEGARRVGYSAMRDSRTGDVILKMVNLLPTSVTVDQEYRGQALRTLLSGTPEDETAAPVSETVVVDGAVKLPPYSLSVYRFKNQK